MFAGDGQLAAQWGGHLEAVEAPPTMIVGVHRAADETLRLHEYSPGFDPERFAAHEKFFVQEVGAWVRSRFGIALSPERFDRISHDWLLAHVPMDRAILRQWPQAGYLEAASSSPPKQGPRRAGSSPPCWRT